MPDESVRMEIRLKNYREVGAVYEEQAVSFLLENGYQIADRNFSCRMGEIDIIAMSPENVIAFVEVKFRKNENYGSPFEAVNERKQYQIFRVASFYLASKNIDPDFPLRFDVIGIVGNGKIKHLENAFTR